MDEECENCGSTTNILVNGFCRNCICSRCGERGTTVEENGWCLSCDELLFPLSLEYPEKY